MEPHKPRILIIDDDPSLRKTLTDILRVKGYEAVAAKDGAEGLAILEESRFDLTLIDLGLPDISGLEVLDRVKAGHPLTETIILTGNGTLDSAIETVNRGAFSYLIKPYDPDQLLLLVRRAIEKHRAEEELVSNHEKLKALFSQVAQGKREWEMTMDAIGDMVILADSTGRIRRCNKAVLEFSGKTYERIIGTKWEDFLGEHGLRARDVLSPGTEIRHEVSGKWFAFNAYPFTDPDSRQISGTVITISDTTELRRTAEALGNAYSELQATQAQMLQREKMASIGQLAAGVAHEINNPLGFILSNLSTLGKYTERLIGFIRFQSEIMEPLVGPEKGAQLQEKRQQLKLDRVMNDTAQLIRESLDGAERVKKIVQDLKSFSRMDEAQWKPADINECLESTLNIVWNEIKYKATVKKELGELPVTRCNPGQLNQVFMNLLVNAAHAIEREGTITLLTRHEQGHIQVTVTDTGCGIPQNIRERIFEPFFTTKEVGKGTGLGLSVSYDIVKKHGGELRVESQVGTGTTFTVTVPVVE